MGFTVGRRLWQPRRAVFVRCVRGRTDGRLGFTIGRRLWRPRRTVFVRFGRGRTDGRLGFTVGRRFWRMGQARLHFLRVVVMLRVGLRTPTKKKQQACSSGWLGRVKTPKVGLSTDYRSAGIFSRRTNQTQQAQVYSHDGPIRRRRRGYILMTDQSDAGDAGIFS